jgi:hypothetical protein
MLLCLLLAVAPDTRRVPADYPTIQKAVDAARDGDTVLVAPGTYRENVRLAGKTITLASRFLESKDLRDVEATVLDGGGRTCVTVEAGVGEETAIVGLTLRGGQDGITSNGARLRILNNRITGCAKEGISFESGGGLVRDNLIEGCGDDGIDCDDAVSVVIEGNTIRRNKDDGIEIRLQPVEGGPLVYEVRGNVLSGNREDGLQLIDYPGRSPRRFLIERNVFHASAMAGLGCMPEGNTVENFGGSAMEEPAVVAHNTFVENAYGMTGAPNLVLVNNVFVGSRKVGLRRVGGASVASHNLFWNNGVDHEECALEAGTTWVKDPLLGEDFRPREGSACIDAGTALLERGGRVLWKLPREGFAGEAPEVGAYERK